MLLNGGVLVPTIVSEELKNLDFMSDHFAERNEFT